MSCQALTWGAGPGRNGAPPRQESGARARACGPSRALKAEARTQRGGRARRHPASWDTLFPVSCLSPKTGDPMCCGLAVWGCAHSRPLCARPPCAWRWLKIPGLALIAWHRKALGVRACARARAIVCGVLTAPSPVPPRGERGGGGRDRPRARPFRFRRRGGGRFFAALLPVDRGARARGARPSPPSRPSSQVRRATRVAPTPSPSFSSPLSFLLSPPGAGGPTRPPPGVWVPGLRPPTQGGSPSGSPPQIDTWVALQPGYPRRGASASDA